MDSIVYITQQPTPNGRGWVPNVKPAMKYGRLKYVFGGGELVYTKPEAGIRKAIEELKNFDPSKDYLMWPSTGDPSAIFVVIMALAGHHGHKEITFLIWDKGYGDVMGGYVPVTFNLKQGE